MNSTREAVTYLSDEAVGAIRCAKSIIAIVGTKIWKRRLRSVEYILSQVYWNSTRCTMDSMYMLGWICTRIDQRVKATKWLEMYG
jgi:hypothetical protein